MKVQSVDSIRKRREASIWTKVHPIFAIGQLGIFVVSLVFLGLYFLNIVPFSAVHLSVLTKVACMVGAVVTGSLWEHDVYGAWWFAPEYVIEDMMTLNVFLLHIGYLVAYYFWPENMRLILSLLVVAYVVYGLNVAQYVVNHVRNQKQEEADEKRRPGIAA